MALECSRRSAQGALRLQLAARQLMVVSLSLVVLATVAELAVAVVVDGSKRSELAPTNNQSSEEEMIDSFNTKTCGLSDTNFEEHEFINMAREGQFPWIVSLQIKVPKDVDHETQDKSAKMSEQSIKERLGKRLEDIHFCSGFFISDKWILSAAHCFSKSDVQTYLRAGKIHVVAGSHKVSSRNPINRNLTIERIYYHSKFDKSVPIGFDVALIELADRVKFGHKREVSKQSGEQSAPLMNAICLPLHDKRYQFNETVRVAGWGMSKGDDVRSQPSKLLTTDILVGNLSECAQIYSAKLHSERPLEQLKKYDDFLCASYKDQRDTCQSDSGGPLMQYADGKAVAVGIVSYGIGCATKGFPGMYTRTSAYTKWIKDITIKGKNGSVLFEVIESTRAPTVSSSTTSTTTSSPSWSDRPRNASGL